MIIRVIEALIILAIVLMIEIHIVDVVEKKIRYAALIKFIKYVLVDIIICLGIFMINYMLNVKISMLKYSMLISICLIQAIVEFYLDVHKDSK